MSKLDEHSNCFIMQYKYCEKVVKRYSNMTLYFTDMCSTYEGSVSQDEQQELTSAPAPPPPPAPYIRPMDISEADDRIKRFYGERIKYTRLNYI